MVHEDTTTVYFSCRAREPVQDHRENAARLVERLAEQMMLKGRTICTEHSYYFESRNSVIALENPCYQAEKDFLSSRLLYL